MASGKSSPEERNHGENVGRKRGKTAEEYDAPFAGFVNVNLSPAQKAQFDVWRDGMDVDHLLDVYARDGVAFGLKIDARGGGFLASATQRRATSVNAGLVVTARSGEIGKALMRLLYELEFMGDKRWVDVAQLADPDRW